MKIGLVRHFKVKHAYPKNFWVSYDELIKWFDDYEKADIDYKTVDMCGVNWKKCYASSSARAVNTAKNIFNGEITILDTLRELQVLSLLNKNLKLPAILWAILIRNKSLTSNIISDQFRKKLNNFLDELIIKNEGEVLIVCHGFVILLLQRELFKRGFKGKQFRSPANGKVYVFEKILS